MQARIESLCRETGSFSGRGRTAPCPAWRALLNSQGYQVTGTDRTAISQNRSPGEQGHTDIISATGLKTCTARI